MKLNISIITVSLLTACSARIEHSIYKETDTEYFFYINGEKIDSTVGKTKMNFRDGLWEYYSKGKLIHKTMYIDGEEIYSVNNKGDTLRPL